MPAEISWINQKLQSLDRDPDAFTQLYGEMKKPMYAVAYRITGNREDAEDSVQEAFVSLLRSEKRASVHNGRAYLFQIVHNEALRRLREHAREVACEDSGELAGAEPNGLSQNAAFSQDDTWHSEFEGSDVDYAMSRLAPEERRIVSLRVEAELGYAEIAKVTGLSLATVFRRYRVAIRKLQEYFGRSGENPESGKE